MKKLVILLALLLCGSFVFADETKLNESNQLVEVENAGAVILFQKQPIYEKQMQIIRVKKSGAISIFQINGKIKDTDNTTDK